MDGRKNNHGNIGNNGGNPGYGKLEFVKGKVNEYSELWWQNWELMMKVGNDTDKRFAMTEFNKIQVKLIPQQLSGDPDNPITVKIAKEIADKNETHTIPIPNSSSTSTI